MKPRKRAAQDKCKKHGLMNCPGCGGADIRYGATLWPAGTKSGRRDPDMPPYKKIKEYKLKGVPDFMRCAAEIGLDIRMDYYKSSGLQTYWTYVGDKTLVTPVKHAFQQDGPVYNHHFRRVKAH